MTVLGLGASGAGNEIRVGFRSGWVRSLAVTVGGVSAVGLTVAALNLIERQPAQMFELLSKWGFVWLLGLVGMLMAWDLAKMGLSYLGKLADSVQDSAVAMNRIADRDDRERDRMVTETAFIGQRLERLTEEMRGERAEHKAHNDRIEELVRSMRQ